MEDKGCCPVKSEKPGEKSGACGMKKCCVATLVKGALVGGIAMAAIYLSSKILAPWNKASMSSLTNEGAVALTMGKAFLLYLFGGLLLTMLLKKVASGCCPIFTSVIVGVLMAAFAHVPNMIFYHSPIEFTGPVMGEIFLATVLTGFAISRLVLKSGKCKTNGCDTTGVDKKAGCH